MKPGLDERKILYVTNRKEWRGWLKRHYKSKKDIWLVYYKKHTGKPRISYNDAVEEALCFGWIDATVKPIDAESFAQRFCPRRKNSVLSQTNIERIRLMMKRRQMTRAGLKAVSHAFDPKTEPTINIKPDVLKAIKSNKIAWRHFQNFPDHYKRIRLDAIESSRSLGKAKFKKTLENFIKKTEKNMRYGQFT